MSLPNKKGTFVNNPMNYTKGPLRNGLLLLKSILHNVGGSDSDCCWIDALTIVRVEVPTSPLYQHQCGTLLINLRSHLPQRCEGSGALHASTMLWSTCVAILACAQGLLRRLHQ